MPTNIRPAIIEMIVWFSGRGLSQRLFSIGDIENYWSVTRCHPTWWRHQKETFSALLAICARNSTVTGEFPAQRPVTRSFHVCLDLRLNKRLSKQSWGWWFETPTRSLWRHCNDKSYVVLVRPAVLPKGYVGIDCPSIKTTPLPSPYHESNESSPSLVDQRAVGQANCGLSYYGS